MNLAEQVKAKISQLGFKDAAQFFETSEPIVAAWFKGTRPITLAAAEKVFALGQPIIAPKLIEEAMWEGKKVAIVLPWYKSVTPLTAFSVMALIDRAKTAIMLNFGDAYIVHTRNVLAEQFLRSGLEWMLTVDDDMVVPWGNAPWFNAFTDFNLPDKFAGMHTLNRLLSHNKTIVGALYFGRWKSGKPVYAEATADKKEAKFAHSGPHDICRATRWVGTGCMLVHKTVFTDIEKQFPHLARGADGKGGQWFTPSEHDLRKGSQEALAILNDNTVTETARVVKAIELMTRATKASNFNSNLGMGEDVAFCIRAAASGHQPHVDLGLLCGHQGSKIYGPRPNEG